MVTIGGGYGGSVPGAAVQRRRMAAGAIAAAVALASATAGALTGSGGDEGVPSSEAKERPATPEPAQLPRGGRSIFPEHRVVAYYGAPQDDELGALGIGTPDQAARRLAKQARPYGRRVLPAMELITVVASGASYGGRYSFRQPTATIRRYLAA